jgi:hypothetical protein
MTDFLTLSSLSEKATAVKRQGGHKYINPYLKYDELLEQWIDGVW